MLPIRRRFLEAKSREGMSEIVCFANSFTSVLFTTSIELEHEHPSA